MISARIGVIGGSGIYNIENLKIIDELNIKTPFGQPSDKIIVGKIKEDENIAFLPRHGRGHRILPTEVNSKANIWALKRLGVERIISFSAVGSLKPEIKPKDFVIPNQLIDKTKSRPNSYFGEGMVGHVQFANPFCVELQEIFYRTIKSANITVHRNETYVCMEGPLFSTKAESFLHKSWGAGLIGMTALPEAKLAREAEICYATIALVTDYDCWHESEEEVSIQLVLQNLEANVQNAKRVISLLAEAIPKERSKCDCSEAAKFAIMTDRKLIPKKTFKKLKLFYGKYF